MQIKTLSFIFFLLGSTCHASGIDLHAHLFMKEGMGWIFSGDFNSALKATRWSNRFSSQINSETLENSQLKVVIAALYAHPLLTFSLRNSIRRQIQLAQDFVKNHPNWIIAKNPYEALQAFQQEKKILILSLEGASGILETEDDFSEFIDQAGIRIVTLLHLTDDIFGGVAFLKGLSALSSPFAWVKSLFSPHYDIQGVRINHAGLTEAGRKVATSLLKRKVWIDLAHSSDRSQAELFPILFQFRQPHLYTHTVLRKYFNAERGISNEQLAQVAQTQGYIGLIPSEQMLDRDSSQHSCNESLNSLITQFREAAQVIGLTSVGIGSDFNGALPHLKPTCKTGTSFDDEGFWNIEQSSQLWRLLYAHLNYSPDSQLQQPELHFLQTWLKLWQADSRNSNS